MLNKILSSEFSATAKQRLQLFIVNAQFKKIEDASYFFHVPRLLDIKCPY